MTATDAGGPRRLAQAPLPTPPRLAALSRRRRAAGLVMTAVGLPVTTASLSHLPPEFGLPSVLLLYLLLIVVVATVGGTWSAIIAALGGFALANFYFTEPKHTFAISEPPDVLALVVFLLVAGVTSVLVDLSVRRARLAERAKAETDTLARLTEVALASDEPLREMVDTLRTAFGQTGVALLRRSDQGWDMDVASGAAPPRVPAEADDQILLTSDVVLAMKGPQPPPADRRILGAFAAQLAVAVNAERLRARAAEAAALAQANDLRGALLAAVSHDLRTPLASIKASVTSLLQTDVEFTPQQHRTFLEAVDEEADRLDRLVGNLLDMSRLQAGALTVQTRPTSLEEVVPAALAGLGPSADRVRVDVAESLPQIQADPALLERVVANLVSNALAYSPDDQPVDVSAAAEGDRVLLTVADQGRGIPAGDRDRVFQPFQRLGDSGDGGVGLGLAVARGFATAMDAALTVADAPGGGTAMTVAIRAV